MKVNVVASVNIWEKITRSLRTLRLDTMRGKFVAFAVLATLFTTLVMTLMLYGRNRRSLSDRIGQELRGASSDAAREMGGWLDQRLYDLRLPASPYVVSDNLARTTGRNAARGVPRRRGLLNNIRQKPPAHGGLANVRAAGTRRGELSRQLRRLDEDDATPGDHPRACRTRGPARRTVAPRRGGRP